MSFRNAALNENNEAVSRTENDMKARATSASLVLDFFGKAGASRGKTLTAPFMAALSENEELAIRALLWTRDIRGGAGERAQFRNLLSELDKVNPVLAGRIMHKVPELGRWDDLFAYSDPINRRKAFAMISYALSQGNGLCAKWMPRKGPVAVELRKALGMAPKSYRKLLVRLTKVVETQMCAKEWDEINFSHVPSLASARYQKAFGRNAPDKYSEYIRELKKDPKDRDPKVKINAGAVYPHDVVKSVYKGHATVADEQWKALPNYVGDAKILPMVDVSGSMGSVRCVTSYVQPIEVAIALGIYLSEKNTSEFKDMFLTFSRNPALNLITGTLSQRIKQMLTAEWGMNTDLHKAFDKVLSVAKSGNVSPVDMPDTILILSDMQFDRCVSFDDSAKQMIERKYRDAGYEMPKIVFWNLRDGGNTPVRFDDRGVALISGFSPAIMKSVLADDLEDFTPYSVMVKTLMDDRYVY